MQAATLYCTNFGHFYRKNHSVFNPAILVCVSTRLTDEVIDGAERPLIR
jgi:hypothetical protein